MPRRLAIHVEEASTAPTVSKVHQDQIRWFSNDQPFTIVFKDESPFFDRTFHIPAGGSVLSGPVKLEADTGVYEYVVRGPAGAADPKVFVED